MDDVISSTTGTTLTDIKNYLSCLWITKASAEWK